MDYEAIKFYICKCCLTQVHGYERCENMTLNTFKKSFFESHFSLSRVMICI